MVMRLKQYCNYTIIKRKEKIQMELFKDMRCGDEPEIG